MAEAGGEEYFSAAWSQIVEYFLGSKMMIFLYFVYNLVDGFEGLSGGMITIYP
jgi:UDP-N-acetylmuramyl pentapeptide phosphotransferase/UDP-N-acetylglucosamine-1-phosphate transferase